MAAVDARRFVLADWILAASWLAAVVALRAFQALQPKLTDEVIVGLRNLAISLPWSVRFFLTTEVARNVLIASTGLFAVGLLLRLLRKRVVGRALLVLALFASVATTTISLRGVGAARELAFGDYGSVCRCPKASLCVSRLCSCTCDERGRLQVVLEPGYGEPDTRRRYRYTDAGLVEGYDVEACDRRATKVRKCAYEPPCAPDGLMTCPGHCEQQ
jgi:hypothetical protein